ncbi:MAG: hypothetical protein JSS07_05540 [Proteobacteria bacterium]|nr:hypothetical protein [Pseudomonadota bacterium]
MSEHSEKGVVLLMVLLFSTLMAMMAHLCIGSAILQQKMLQNFKSHYKIKKEAEITLNKIETQLGEIPGFSSSQVSWIQFVPDTLAFGEKKGTDFYRVEIEHKEAEASYIHLISTICLRKTILFPIYLRGSTPKDNLTLYLPAGKSLQRIFSWPAPPNIKLSDPAFFINNKLSYVLGSDNYLYGINELGETYFNWHISEFVKGISLEDQAEVVAKPLLKVMNIFEDIHKPMILVGGLSTQPVTLFRLDITDPYDLVETPENYLRWTKILTKAKQLDDLILTKIVNGKWVGLATIRTQNQSEILIIDILTAEIIKTFYFDQKITSQIVAIDSKSQGYSDAFYVGDEAGTLWKGSLSDKLSYHWTIKGFTELVDGIILGTPIVGKDPHGNIMVFLTIENATKQKSIYALIDNERELSNSYQFEINASIQSPVLWQNYLLAQDRQEHLVIYDAFTGLLLQRLPIVYNFLDKSIYQEDNTIQILTDKLYDKQPLVVVTGTQGIGFCEATRLASRLGRKTWQIKHH